jgi:hypothetical protein
MRPTGALLIAALLRSSRALATLDGTWHADCSASRLGVLQQDQQGSGKARIDTDYG